MTLTAEERIASRQKMSDMMKGHVEEALEKLDADPSSEFDVSIESMVSSCNHRFHAFTQPPGYWAIDLHDLWREFIWCAKGTPADDTRQDMRTMQILRLRERGVAINTEEEIPREARTEEGDRIWVDLPYLVADLRDAWENALQMKPAHLTNLAAWTARLAGVGVGGDDLAFCMLQLCKQVLETELPTDGPSEVEILPAIYQWFKHCGDKIYRLCISNSTFAEGTRILPGLLAQRVGVHDTGFSGSRWLFWRQTVKGFALSKDEKLAVEGKRVFDRMMGVGQEMQNKMPGERRYWEKVREVMHHELAERQKTGGENSVGMEEVAIDLNWVDDLEKDTEEKADVSEPGKTPSEISKL